MQQLVNPTILAATPAPSSKERLPTVLLDTTLEHNVAAPETALRAPAPNAEVCL